MPSDASPSPDTGASESSSQKASHIWRWVLVGAAVIVVGCGLLVAVCYGGGVLLPRYFSESISGTATAQADATATASAVLAAPPADWQIAIEDSFDSNVNNWWLDSREADWGSETRQIDRGHFIWDFYSERGWVVWALPRPVQLFGDFYLTVEALRTNGSPEAAIHGVVFRHNSTDNYAVFEVEDYGYFDVLVHENDEWVTIIPWNASEAIHYGDVNRLTVLAEGTHFYFFINDALVGEADITNVDARGQIGLYINAEEGQEGTVEFDNLAVYEP